MYNVNTNKINEILTFVEQDIVRVLRDIMQQPREMFLEKGVLSFAASRLFHLLIESMTDVGNFLIDGFIMRDPGSYEDIVDIMEDQEVYPHEEAQVYKEIILLRKALVIDYITVEATVLYDLYHRHVASIERYPVLIRDYLKRELW